MAVGDIHSDAPGSGARYNDGKLAMDLIPVRFWLRAWEKQLEKHGDLYLILRNLALFQEYGDEDAIGRTLDHFGSNGLCAATKVLEFGAKKYAAWNWAKGMNWSVPTGCILRHALTILEGEPIDEESGHSHIAHILCNFVMLQYFITDYRQGDDRPPVSPGVSCDNL